MWNNLLHPSINKDSWTLDEDSLLEVSRILLTLSLIAFLQEALKKGGICHWDFVSTYLRSGRTPYQCFVRYMTAFKVDDNLMPWTQEEDEKLKVLIKTMAIGSYIPWLQVRNNILPLHLKTLL